MSYLVSAYILIMNLLNTIAKSKKYFFYTTIFLMILLFAGISKCADNEMYKTLYSFLKIYGFKVYASAEIGFTFFIFLLAKIGFSYLITKVIIAAIGLYFLQSTALKYTKNYNLVFILYFIYPFILDAVQFRNFLAYTIIIFSFRFLIQESKHSNIKYAACILIAFSIHYMSIFFLPFLFVKKYSVNSLIRNSLLITPILCLLAFTQVIPELIHRIVFERVAEYIDTYFRKVHWGFILMWLRQMAITVIAYFCYLYMKNSDVDEKLKSFSTFVVKLSIYLVIVCFPLLMFNGNFFRLLRPLLFLDYILISQVIYIKTKESYLYAGLSLIIVLMFFIMDIGNPENVKNVLIPFFQNNSFFNSIN